MVLRGLAIIAIMMHNLLHYSTFGLSAENEMDYIQANANSFISALISGHSTILAEYFSFLGWTGVPVFVFLTGYGLTKKYHYLGPKSTRLEKKNMNADVSSKDFDKKRFIRHNFLKLFWLMLPAILFFLLLDAKNQEWVQFFKRLTYLAMLPNFDYPHLMVKPGVYWYFGFTFQCYLFFLFARNYFSSWNLLLISALSLIGVYIVEFIDYPPLISWYRHSLLGWLSLLALGIWLANQDKLLCLKTSIWIEILLFLFLFVLVLIMNANIYSWLFVPIVSLGSYFFAAMLICRMELLKILFIWIGKYSACIFVCNPITRILGLKCYSKTDDIILTLVLYLLLTLFFSLVYMEIYKLLKRIAL